MTDGPPARGIIRIAARGVAARRRAYRNPPVQRPRLCVFDLDGTLIDSLQDVARAANTALELLGLTPRPLPDYRYLVGEGLPNLCSRLIGASHPHLVARLTELARAWYRAGMLEHTRPYPGVCPMLDSLRGAGMHLAVLSNKPHDMTVRIVRSFWPDDLFARVVGYTAETLRKPDPTMVLRICADLDVPPSQTCLVGDTPIDVETAARAGTCMLAVTWGFRTRADLESAGATRLADSPADVPRLLGCCGSEGPGAPLPPVPGASHSAVAMRPRQSS